jgi:hypothetical protein
VSYDEFVRERQGEQAQAFGGRGKMPMCHRDAALLQHMSIILVLVGLLSYALTSLLLTGFKLGDEEVASTSVGTPLAQAPKPKKPTAVGYAPLNMDANAVVG